MAYIHDWYAMNDVLKKSDIQIVKQVLIASQKKLRVDVEKNDPLHFIHVNVIWAMLEDLESTIIQMTWVRAQYILAIQDENW